MVPHVYRPDEHSLLTDMMGVESGIPAISCAILKCISPAPTIRLLPTQISCIFLGSILDLLITP